MNYEPAAWRKAYREDGYVIVPDLIDPRTLALLRERLDRITRDPSALSPDLRGKLFFERQHVANNPKITDITPEECGDSVRQIEDLALFDSAFAELICYPPLLDVLEVLFESDEFGFYLLQARPKAARFGNGIMNFHRDTPSEQFTSADTATALLFLDEVTPKNGPTVLARGSQRVSDEEAGRKCWLDVAEEELNSESLVEALCPAGAGLFFSSKIIHAARHNRSARPRRTILSGWAGPGVLPTSAARLPYQGLRPRSKTAAREKQVRMSFPHLFVGESMKAN
ncbi:MAG TPA: phytanoyl-CoA dioxygenase family protein [Pyrinomonadaceae bacterium]|nr:phytanoyl-CoA dioxygenase family protein [Pyrinomonadaceae bacterium]